MKVSCGDQPNPGVEDRGGALTCKQLTNYHGKNYCQDSNLGAHIREKCPVSCRTGAKECFRFDEYYDASHHFTSHHFTSHHFTSYHTTPHHITPHHITSHPDTTPHHIISHHIISTTPHYITPHHITSLILN